MDDIHLALSNDREQYGPAFALRQTIYHEFGRKKEVKEVINEAFGLPAGVSLLFFFVFFVFLFALCIDLLTDPVTPLSRRRMCWTPCFV
jgi:hypothetical protein